MYSGGIQFQLKFGRMFNFGRKAPMLNLFGQNQFWILAVTVTLNPKTNRFK